MAQYEELTVGKLYLEKGMNGVGTFTELTDNSGGAVSTTLAAISATPTQAEVANSVASLNAQINKLYTALKSANLIA